MVKKRLPDWLNSPMWSSPTVTTSPPPKSRSLSPPPPPPSSSNDDRYGIGSYPSKSSSVTSSDSSLNEPHVPLPPPTSIKQEPTPKTRIRDSSTRSVNSDNDVSSSIEDVSRQAQLLEELSRKIINIGELRQLCLLGIPDAAGIRSTVWKLLLAYLPTDKGLWSLELAKKRAQYKQFKENLLMNPSVRNHQDI